MSRDQHDSADAQPMDVPHPRGAGLADPATTQVARSATPVAPGRRNPRSGTRRGLVVFLLLVLVAGGVATRSWWAHRNADIRSGTTSVDVDGMAARNGIRVSLIGVTAAGGLVEFRYQVVDPDKANGVLHDPDLAPALVVEETGATLVMSSPAHHHGADLKLGGTYFFLLANAHNAVHTGSHVTLVIGKARLEHLLAQG
jgi:hypothetical protein